MPPLPCPVQHLYDIQAAWHEDIPIVCIASFWLFSLITLLFNIARILPWLVCLFKLVFITIIVKSNFYLKDLLLFKILSYSPDWYQINNSEALCTSHGIQAAFIERYFTISSNTPEWFLLKSIACWIKDLICIWLWYV